MKYPSQSGKWPRIEVYGKDFRPALLDMAEAITALGLWDWMRAESPPHDKSYVCWGHANVFKIESLVRRDDHTESTFGYCLRQMRIIAQIGYDEWADPKYMT